GRATPALISSRARATADASRLPPPTLPQTSSRPTTILAPASRGAWPRTSATVISTPGAPPLRSCRPPSSQSTSHPRVHGRRGGRIGGPGAPPGRLDRPVDGFRGRRAGQLDRVTGGAERADGLAQRFGDAERLHQRR